MSRLIWHGDKILRRIERESPPLIRRIAEVIARIARRLVPVKSGKLQASIQVTDEGIEVTEDYAAKVEFGTATRAAQPYMRPAIEQFNQEDLEQCVR